MKRKSSLLIPAVLAFSLCTAPVLPVLAEADAATDAASSDTASVSPYQKGKQEALHFDGADNILDMIQNLRTPIGDVVVPLITRLGDAGIIWIILTVLLLIIPKTRKTGVIMMAALLVDVLLCNVLIKNLVARTRPFDVNTAVQLLIAKPQDYSFPSGHTAASFASVTALYLAGEKKMWKAALVLAVLIALSRLYLYVHYPTDIIGGVIFGSLSGYLGYKIVEQIRKKR